MDIDISKKVRVWWDGGEVIGYLDEMETYDELDDIHYNWYSNYPLHVPRWAYYMKFVVRSVNGSTVIIDTRTITQFKMANI